MRFLGALPLESSRAVEPSSRAVVRMVTGGLRPQTKKASDSASFHLKWSGRTILPKPLKSLD